MMFTIESYYTKKTDGYVYYYWRMVGSDTWNVQKTAMKEVPAIELKSAKQQRGTKGDINAD